MKNNTRDKIIEAAAMLIAHKGLYGFSIAKAAWAAEVDANVAAEFFPSDTNLYEAVLENQFSLYASKMEAVFDDDNASPTEKVMRFAQAMCEVHQQAPHFFPIYYWELLNPSLYFQTIIEPRIRHVAYLSDNNIARGIQKGMFKHGLNPANMTMLLAGTLHYFFLATRLAPSLLPERGNDEEYFNQVLEVFMTGLKEQRASRILYQNRF